jgi:hypothetical protein
VIGISTQITKKGETMKQQTTPKPKLFVSKETLRTFSSGQPGAGLATTTRDCGDGSGLYLMAGLPGPAAHQAGGESK